MAESHFHRRLRATRRGVSIACCAASCFIAFVFAVVCTAQESAPASPTAPSTTVESPVESGAAPAATLPSSAPPIRTSSEGDEYRDAEFSRGPPGSSQTSPPTSAKPTGYKLLRYDEDYRYLKDPALRTDFWDPLKYIPLSDSDDWFLSLGGEARERFEAIKNDDLGGLPTSDGYLQQRYLFHTDLHLGESLRAFGQLQSGFLDGRDAGPRPDIDRNTIDAHQGFVDLVTPIDLGDESGSITWRGGRQEMTYGSGRLIDVREGPTLRRSFDGARFLTRAGDLSLDGWWTRPVRNLFGAFDDSPDPNRQFWGLYGTHPVALLPSGNVDFYYLGFEDREAVYNRGAGRELRHSLGTRIWARPLPWEYNLEYVWQFGQFGAGRISAWTAAQAIRYNFSDLPLKPRPGIRFDIASGDSGPNSSTLGTFNPLFPSGVYFNLANPIGPKNIIDLHPTFDVFFGDQVTLTFDWNFFWRESLGDGIYRLSGSLLRPAGGSHARFIGHSPALTMTWTPSRHITVLASYVYFGPGAFIKDNPPDQPLNFFTTWLTYKF